MHDETTVLDLAHAAMEAAPEDAAARLRFYGRLAESELCVLIRSDEGDRLEPVVFALAEGRFVMAFDREDRLAAFADAPSPYAAVPGRALVQQLAGQGLGLGLNLGVAPSAFLMPPDAVDWLAATLGAAPEVAPMRPVRLAALDGAAALLDAVAPGLEPLRGIGRAVAAVRAVDGEGHETPVLAVIGAPTGSQEAIAKALAETLVFASGAAAPDILFLAPDEPLAAEALALGAVFDLTPVAAEPASAPAAPGSDPDRPPRLR